MSDEFDQQKFDRDTLIRLEKVGYALHHGSINYGTASELLYNEMSHWTTMTDTPPEELNQVDLDPEFHEAIYGMPDAPPRSEERRYKRAELVVKAMLKRAWDLNEIAKMSFEDYQDFFNQFEYVEGE